MVLTECQPLFVAAVAYGDGVIEFRTRTELVKVTNNLDLLNEIILLCDGRSTQSAIATKLSRRTGVTKTTVQAVIDDLITLEVVIDSRAYTSHTHKTGNNPMSYSHQLSDEQVESILDNRPDYLVATHGTLESVKLESSPLRNLLQKRTSTRNFIDVPLSYKDYVAICEAAYGDDLNPVPSGGGLYPLSLFVLVTHDSSEVPAGVYQYDPSRNALAVVETPLDRDDAEFALNSDTLLHGASAVLVIAGDIDRHPSKYANRGYRYTLIEAGHVAQNAHLAAIERELATLEYGGFKDDALRTLLHIEQESVWPLITVAFGIADPNGGEKDTGNTAIRKSLEASLVGKNKPLNWVVPLHKETTANAPFNIASAHYKPSVFEDARQSYDSRIAAGTSASQDLAVIKAIAEGFERYSFGKAFVDKESSAENLDAPWVDPSQYVPFTDWQRKQQDFERFDPAKTWQWVRGEDAEGKLVYVPTDLVFYPYNAKAHGRKLCYSAHSNGSAAHTSLEQAKLNAVHELVERDAIARNWLRKTTPNRIPFDFLPLHWRKRVLFWQEQGWGIDVVDFSHSGVAVVSVFARRKRLRPYLAHGSAASSISFEHAVDKAFQELEVSLAVQVGQRYTRIQPERVESPGDHGRLYHFDNFAHELDYLFEGDFIDERPIVGGVEVIKQFNPIYVTVSPKGSPLWVVRALSSRLVPINFGYARDHIAHELLRGSVDQLVAPFPHYLA